MAKYSDVRSLGRSEIAPFIEGENPRDRHSRRKGTASFFEQELSKWCNESGWKFEIKNEGHHWIFRKNKTLVEWWPSSAKLVKDKKWSKAVHCHDYLKVIKYIEGLKNV